MAKTNKYVDTKGNPIVQNKDPRNTLIKYGFIVIGIIVVISVGSILIGNKSKSVCYDFETKIKDFAYKYASDNNLLPAIGGLSVTVNLSDLVQNKVINKKDIIVKEDECSGNVKITKYKDEYIKTINLTNCDYCSTDKNYGEYGKELDKYPKGNGIVDIVPYYNYYNKELSNTAWTSWMASKYINEKEKYGVRLPIKESSWPKVPDDAKNITYDVETATYYSYRDKKWKYYKVNNPSYSGFSSEQPEGYSNKDTSTMKYTDYSEWSTKYPDKKDYRSIQTKVGYRWYYLNKQKKKVYWENGMYNVEQPDDKYTEKDKNSKVTMYRYRDQIWRWYNGEKRVYSSYSSTMPKGYNYIDTELMQYTNWTSYKPTSSLNSDNSNYREEVTDTYYRYRAKYYLYSFLVLDNHLNKEAFENKVGKSLSEIESDDTKQLDIKYKFLYRKAK